MSAIHTLKIKNFKAFPIEEEIELAGNNLLIYGENGSGKSSVYFALYTLLQAGIKGKNTDKYFDRSSPESLLNVFTDTSSDAYIKVSFTENPGKFYTLEAGGIKPADEIEVIEKLNLASDFLSYRLLINFYNFRNSNQINVFKVFELDIFPYVKTSDQKAYLSDLYNDIKNNIPYKLRKGNIEAKQVSRKYLEKIDYFNSEVETLANNINLEASDFYNEHFRQGTENKIEIRLYYQSDDSLNRESGDTNSYFLRYEEVFKKIVIANEEREYKTKFKDLSQPFIRLAIRENTGTDDNPTWKQISRPQSYLNEAKLTGIALSIRFALLVGNNRPQVDGRLLALDDLLVSLDMSNRDRVIGIILNLFVKTNPYKIYLFTHDKAFYNLCKQRIHQSQNSSNWLFKEMYVNEDVVPRRPFIDNSTDAFQKAVAHLRAFDYPASANSLRQGLENFIFSFLPENQRYKIENDQIKRKGLAELLATLKSFLESFGQDNTLINDLFVYKDLLLNPLSHDNINTPVFKNELDAVIATLPTLRKLSTVLLRDIDQNSVVKFFVVDNKGIERIYDIELYEHLRNYILLDGKYYLSKSKCKNIKCVTPEEPEMLFNNEYPTISRACNRIAEIVGLGKNKFPTDDDVVKQLNFD